MTVEIIIGLSIISVSLLAFLNVAEKSVSLSQHSVRNTQAAFLLEEGAEAVRILRDNDWSNISSLSLGTNYYPTLIGTTWSLSATPNSVDGFTRVVNVSAVNRDASTQDISTVGNIDARSKLVTVTVSWLRGTTTQSKSLQFYLMDIFN